MVPQQPGNHIESGPTAVGELTLHGYKFVTPWIVFGMIQVIAAWVLFFSAFFLIYTWLLYPLLLWAACKWWERPIERGEVTPTVSILLKCFNEAAQLAQRIENLLALDYPREQLELWVGSDGSTDKTYEIAHSYEGRGIKAVKYPRLGPALMHNSMMARATGEIVVFTDAGTRFPRNLLWRIVRPFADSRVGCVPAEIDFVNRGESAIAQHRGFYWKVEYAMRRAEGRLGILAIGTGACMAVRRSLLKPLAKASYDVDFITPMDVVAQGGRVVVEPGVAVTDSLLSTARGEFRAGVRMVAKNFRGTLDHLVYINPLRYPGTWISLFSHKIFRWLTPFSLLLILVANAVCHDTLSLRVLLVLQGLFYTAAILGAFGRGRVARRGLGWVLAIPFSFCLANVAFLFGILRGIFGKPITAFQNVQ